MSKIVKFVTIFIIFIIALFVFGNKDANAASTNTAISIEKDTYNEATGILVVKVYAEPGLKWYNLIFNINTSLVYVKSYNSGAALTNDARVDFAVSTDLQVPLDDISYSNGTISIETEEAEDASTEEEVVCRIKMQLKDICKEEEIPNGIITLESIIIKDENEDLDDSNSLVKIYPFKKAVSSISVSDVEFEKDKYIVGDTINIASGTLTINYDNSGRNTGSTRIVDLSTLQDTNGISVDVVKGGWTAVYPNTNVNLTYGGKTSNSIQVTVHDKVTSLQIEDKIQKEYEYGANEVNVNDSMVYIHLKSGRTLETSLSSLIQEGKAEIKPDFATFATPKTSVTQQLTITITLPEFDEYVETATLAEVTVLPEGVSLKDVDVPEDYTGEITSNLVPATITDTLQSISWVEMPNDKCIYGESLDKSEGNFEATYISGQKSDPISISNSNVTITEMDGSPFNNTNLTTRDLLVTYKYVENNVNKTKTLTYQITIEDYIVDIEFFDDMDKTYEYGQTEYRLNNSTIKPIMASGTEEESITLSDLITFGKASITPNLSSLGEVKKTVTKPITITINIDNYEIKEFTRNITVYDPVTNIELIHEPNKKEYVYGEAPLSLEGGTIKVTYKSNQTEQIYLSNEKVTVTEQDGSQFDNTLLGRRNLKITYNYLENYTSKTNENLNINLKYEIEVKEPEDTILDVRFDEGTMKKVYKYGEKLDLSGAKIIVTKLSGEYIVNLTEETIQNFKLTQIGHLEYDLSYYEYVMSKAIKIDVEDYIVDLILIKPNKTTYKLGEELDLTGCELKYLMASGILGDPVAVTEDMISGYENEILGTQRVKVTFENYEKYFEIIIAPQTGVSGISTYSSLIIIIEMSIIGIFMTLALQKIEIIKKYQKCKKT